MSRNSHPDLTIEFWLVSDLTQTAIARFTDRAEALQAQLASGLRALTTIQPVLVWDKAEAGAKP